MEQTNGTDKLEEILQVGQTVGNKSGLGFVAAKKSGADKKIRSNKQISKQMSQHNSQHQEQGHIIYTYIFIFSTK